MKSVNLNNYELTSFVNDLKEFNIIPNEDQLSKFMRYYELLIEWNRVMNLTAITDFDDVLKKHFLDSLSLVKIYSDFSDKTLIDIGTGAGFPGIPLKIIFPELKITLLDSLNKRINFLNTVIEELELKDIETLHGRAENFSKKELLREKYDICVSRAVANLSTLSEYCLPYVKVGGGFISYKSGKSVEEIEGAKKAISILGGKIENTVEFIIPDSDISRNLILIRKIKNTPNKYPRKEGVPSRTPII